MKLHVLAASAAAVSVIALSGCGEKKEDPAAAAVDPNDPASVMEAMGAMKGGEATGPMKDYVAGMNEIAAAIDSIDDEASAKRAAQDIAASIKDLEKLKERLEGKSEQEMQVMAMQNAGALMQSAAAMSAAMMKLQTEHPELLQVVSDEIDKIPNLDN